MRLILFLAVIALAVDAINFSGAYSQTAWNALRSGVAELTAEVRDRGILDREPANAETRVAAD